MHLAALTRAFISTTVILETSPFALFLLLWCLAFAWALKDLSVLLVSLLRTFKSYAALLRLSSLALLLCPALLRVSSLALLLCPALLRVNFIF